MLDAAVSVFSRRGYHPASMDEISDTAGVSKPMIYAYLGPKEDLFTACIRREGARLADDIAEAAGTVHRPDEQLRAGLLAFFRFVLDHRDGWIVLYRQARAQGGTFAEEIAGMRQNMIRVVAGLLAHADGGERGDGTDRGDRGDRSEVGDRGEAGDRGEVGDRVAQAMPTAHALAGAAEALSDWGLEQPGMTAESLTDHLMDFAWNGLGHRVRSEHRRSR